MADPHRPGSHRRSTVSSLILPDDPGADRLRKRHIHNLHTDRSRDGQHTLPPQSSLPSRDSLMELSHGAPRGPAALDPLW
jgi:hypothetical protein